MANTVIQLKYSTVTSTPSALNVAEPAYSYTSNTLFIGSPSGTGAIAIGGKFYLDQQQIIFDVANGAFTAANNSTKANSAFDHANAAFNQANSAFNLATNNADINVTQNTNISYAWNHANSAFSAANNEAGVNATQNNSITAAFIAANSSGEYANASFITANLAFEAANSSGSYANSAFSRANNSISANSGGTITGDLSITGNLNVLGNTFTVSSTTIVANDTVIILGANNYTSDLLDIGFAAHYNDGANAHTGLIRDHFTKEWQLFEGYTQEIGANNDININDPSFKVATLHANLKTQLITLNGQNLQIYVDNSYNHSNAAFNTANNEAGVNLTQNNSIDAAFTAANSSGSYANSAFAAANTADDKATSAGIYANGAFSVANSAQAHADAGFNHANAAFSLANGTAVIANTDVTGVSVTAGDYGIVTGGFAFIPGFKLEANGRISQANSTLLQVDTSAINSGTFSVARGGTGANTFTTNGVLLGQGTSSFTTASSSTEGHVLTINASGVPTFEHLSGGTF